MKIGILWDLDGTLLDTLEDLQDGVNHALAQFGLPPRTREEVRSFVGNGARNLLLKAVDGRADLDEAVKAFHAYYDVNCIGKTRPYAGIPDALAKLGDGIRGQGHGMEKGQIERIVLILAKLMEFRDIHIGGDAHIGIGHGKKMLQMVTPGKVV